MGPGLQPVKYGSIFLQVIGFGILRLISTPRMENTNAYKTSCSYSTHAIDLHLRISAKNSKINKSLSAFYSTDLQYLMLIYEAAYTLSDKPPNAYL